MLGNFLKFLGVNETMEQQRQLVHGNPNIFPLSLTQGPFGSEDGKVGGQKMGRGQKSERIEKILVFLICVWLEVWKSEEMKNFFIWLEREIGGQKMEFV